MKKILPIILLALIIPQVALAAWWNPFTWKIFKKNTPVVEQVRQEPQATDENSKDNSVEPPVQLPTTTPNTNPSPSITPSTKTLISCNGQSYEDTCAPQGLKTFCGPDRPYCATQQQIDNLKVCNGVTYNATCSAGTEFFCPTSGQAYCKLPGSTQSVLDSIDQQRQREMEQQKQQEERKNSPECREATASLDKIREDIKSARELSDRYYNEYKTTNKDSSFLKYMEYSREATNLSSDQSLLLSDYYRICEGVSALPPIPKTYNTTCYTNSYGLISCTTY